VKLFIQIAIGAWVVWLAVLLAGCMLTQFIGSPFTDWLKEIRIWWWFIGSLAVPVFGEKVLQKLLQKSK
jgi:hypothetical protein